MFARGFAYFSVLLFCFPACHGVSCPEEKGSEGYRVTSPGFKNSKHYPSDWYCESSINKTVKPGKQASLRFRSFKVDGKMPTCSGDYVEVFVGCEPNSRSMGKYCSELKLPTFHSPDHCVKVVFKSVKVASKSNDATCPSPNGFEGVTNGFEGVITELAQSDVAACSNNDLNSELMTPGWPQNYEPGANCTWNINTADASAVVFFFTSFELEPRVECNAHQEDRFTIHGIYSNGRKTLIRRVCDRDAARRFTIDTDQVQGLQVEFVADGDGNVHTGFAGGYVIVDSDKAKERKRRAFGEGSNSCTVPPPSRTPGSSCALLPVKVVLLALAMTVFIFSE